MVYLRFNMIRIYAKNKGKGLLFDSLEEANGEKSFLQNIIFSPILGTSSPDKW